jgi:hypothetical protein
MEMEKEMEKERKENGVKRQGRPKFPQEQGEKGIK